MRKELFDELLESVIEGGQILRGEVAPSRSFEMGAEEVKRIRARHNLSQSEFARVLGISVDTLQNWEQGRRKPDGSARVLMRVFDRNPNVVSRVAQPGMKAVGKKLGAKRLKRREVLSAPRDRRKVAS